MTEEVYENYVKLLNLSKKNFTALKLKNVNDEINNFFMNGYCSKIGNLREAHQKSLNEMEELKRFQSSTFDIIYCKTKISRGPGHYFGTYWQDTGFAK